MKKLYIITISLTLLIILCPILTLPKPKNVSHSLGMATAHSITIYTPPYPLSPTLLDIVEHSERFSPVPYLCPSNKLTIGYGFRLSKKDTTKYMSQQTAKKILSEKLLYIKKDMEEKYPYLNENQAEALTSLIYNIGMGTFNKSKLKGLIEKGNIKAVKKIHFLSFRKADGKVLRGLELRRRKEWELWEARR